MKSNTYASSIPDKLKLKLFNQIKNLTNIFYYQSAILRDQSENEGYAMIKINDSYKFIKIKLYHAGVY